MRLLTIFLTLIMGSAAYAADDNESNIFKADISHPDLANAVTSFENICLPFVLHETELNFAQDLAHHQSLLEKQNFMYQSKKNCIRKNFNWTECI